MLFFGTARFAVPSLFALHADPAFEVIAVVTQPDRPAGRGQSLGISPIKRAATTLGLPVLQPRRVRARSFLDTAAMLQPDFIALAAYGQFIPQELLNLPPLGPVNLHGSLLPAYRGAAPIQHAILDGKRETGVTTMWMDAGMDTGDILLEERVPIEADDDAGSLTERLADVGAGTLCRTLRLLAEGVCPRKPQPAEGVSYAPPIGAEDCVLSLEEPAERLANRIRALSPKPGAFAEYHGRRLKVWRAEARPGDAEPGAIISVEREGAAIGTGNGVLLLMEVQAEGAKRMNAADWANGARAKPGDRFAVNRLTKMDAREVH